MSRTREQRLVDIAFQLVFVALTPSNATRLLALSRKEQMAWVAQQLREAGFPTRPCGASWGVLTDD